MGGSPSFGGGGGMGAGGVAGAHQRAPNGNHKRSYERRAAKVAAARS